MPRVRILKTIAGDHFAWSAGSELDMTDDEAAVWCDGVHAELVVVDAPRTALVGEQGPELVQLPRSTKISRKGK